MFRLFTRRLFTACALAALMLVAACSRPFSRDDFTTAVMGKSEQEVMTAIGKPASVKEDDAEHATWTYSRQTFDLNNQNRMDSSATVIFQGPAGKRYATKVDFS
jgi:hypothetical protein